MAKDFSNLTDPPYNRGIVNNNPGNLRIGIPWQGLKLGLPGAFCSFVNLSYGIRAMAIDLSNKITKDGLNTIRLEVTKYAPPSENDTQKYIDRVCASTGWGADDPIDLTDPNNLLSLIRAHISVEQGDQSKMITDQDITDGMALMGQSIFSQGTNFFVTNPEVSAALGLGIIAVLLVILGVVYKQITVNLLKRIL